MVRVCRSRVVASINRRQYAVAPELGNVTCWLHLNCGGNQNMGKAKTFVTCDTEWDWCPRPGGTT